MGALKRGFAPRAMNWVIHLRGRERTLETRHRTAVNCRACGFDGEALSVQAFDSPDR